MDGIVVDIKLFSRKERDDRAKSHEKKKLQNLQSQKDQEIAHVKEKRRERLEKLMIGQTTEKLIHSETGEKLHAQWWDGARSIGPRPDDKPDADPMVSCRLGGATRFTKRSDCLARGGSVS